MIAVMERQAIVQRLLGLAPPGFVMTDGMDLGRARLLHQGAQDVDGLASPQDQATAQFLEILRKRRQAVMQPPALRRAHPPVARGFVIEV